MDKVGLIVLGSVLALFGTVGVEFLRNWNSNRRMKNHLLSILEIEINTLMSGIEIVLEEPEPEETDILIDLVGAMRLRLEGYRDAALLFRQETFRDGLINFFRDLEVFYLEVRVKKKPEIPLSDDLKDALGSFKGRINALWEGIMIYRRMKWLDRRRFVLEMPDYKRPIG